MSAALFAPLTLRAQSEGTARATFKYDLSRPLVDRQPLVVGATSDSFPYGYVGANGEWTGFSTDLFDAVALEMRLRIQRVGLPGRELHDRFRLGEFDVLQAYSQTHERGKYTEFSVPFLTLRGAIFVRKNGPIRKIDDLNGTAFAIIGAGSIGEAFVRDHHLTIRPIYVSSSEEGLKLVDEGRCAGVFVSHLTAIAVIERTRLRNVAMLEKPLTDYDIRHCFAVHLGDAQLLARINEGLAILNRNGEYQRIHRKWFGRYEEGTFSREQVVAYVAAALALAFFAALWGLLRQRSLLTRIAAQSAELAEKEGLLSALYRTLPTAMCVLEASDKDNHRVISLNPQAEEILRIKSGDAHGRDLADLPVEPEIARHLHELLRRWKKSDHAVREERKLSSTRKHIVFTLMRLAPGPSGRPRLCLLADDVTRRRELDEEIGQSRRLRAVGELVGGIAHEFNNLLTPVMLKVGEIQSDWMQDTRLQEEITVVHRAVMRAAELTHRLLAFGRKAEARAEQAHLASLATHSLELLRQTVDRRIVLENAIPGDLPPLYLNATDIHQVLLNLLLNARDTLAEKLAQQPSGWTPRIRVAAEQLAADKIDPPHGRERPSLGWQRLTVRDNGMGMSAEVRERIFEPFYTTKAVGSGSGLGLATVWHIVAEAGGRIDVESAPGEGTTFVIILPVRSPPAPKTPHTDPGLPAAAGALRIFLAEDEELIAKTLVRVLQRAGHTVEHAPDGSVAWDRLETHLDRFQVLIFDINMPGIDGIELSRRVRASGKFTGKLLIISGRLTPAEFDVLARIGVDGTLAKPFTMPRFLQAIQELRATKPAATS